MKKQIYMILALLLFCGAATAQRAVTGKVTDESGQPMAGVAVVVKGTTNGTSTSGEGMFSMSNVKDSDILTFSFIGYATEEVSVGARSNVEVQMKTSSIELEGVVAIGYGSMRKSDLTGSVGSVSVTDLARTATSNYDQALSGRIAGVQVSSVDGTPGAGLNIVIRGGNSITGDNSPLYVVDGIPYENFNPSSISSNDIEELNVLKDASSTAIYGSRGANGVIVINTKSGRMDGKTDISVNVSHGVSWIPTRLEVLGPYDYVLY